MTPSKQTTAGQIDKAVANYRALLDKHSGEFNAEVVQMVLGQPELAGEQFAVFRRRVEAVSNLIIRIVKVNRTRTPQQALDATDRTLYTNSTVVSTMPQGSGEETEVVFFQVGRNIGDDDLEKEYEFRGLVPVDPYSLAAVNETDPVFADQHPNCTHWKDADGKWCFAFFGRWDGGRVVSVRRSGYAWVGIWCFAGVRKVVTQA